MKKVLVVALYKNISEYYRGHLASIFGDLVRFENYYIENNPEELEFEGDLIITSSNILFEHVKRLNKNKMKTIVMSRTFTKEGFEKVKALDDGREMYFVSNFYEIAIECISKLYELGIKDIKFIPYNPMSPYDEKTTEIKTAVIAGDTEMIPDFIQEVIDIGDRVIDLSTIADIGAILRIPNKALYRILDDYNRELVYTDYGINQVLSDSGEIKRQLKTILSFTNDSIIATDLAGYITEYNEASERNFSIKKSDVVGRHINQVFPEIQIGDVLQNEESVNNELVEIRQVTYVVNKYGMYSEEGVLAGTVIFFQKYMEMENEQSKLRSKLIPSGHVAKYTMNHVLGCSKVIADLKVVAQKMARSNSTVLITGESGTGKEVFAQAIHNASERKNKPFIVVNCSALAASLLESELFGYEEGAFTGAKKGGKIGLFEMADKGTIFLDEIGEMPYELQAKLLRVLMEKEVMRIGGVNIIKIDVRVIAATNKNLLQLVNEGQFREDLYYRINVLPLPLPPLRERKCDIPVLVEHFLKGFGGEKELTDRILKVLIRYDWPGNIRELHNCVEYMYQLSDEKITLRNIPENISSGNKTAPIVESRLTRREQDILEAIFNLDHLDKPTGRKALHQYFLEKGLRIGEQEIRYDLKRLAEMGLVQVNKGRRGTVITDEGKGFVRKKIAD